MAIAQVIGSGSVKGGSTTRKKESVKGGSSTVLAQQAHPPTPPRVKPPVWREASRADFLGKIEAFCSKGRCSRANKQAMSEFAAWIAELKTRNLGFSGSFGRIVVAVTNRGMMEEVLIAIKTPEGISVDCIARFVSKTFSNGTAAKVVDFRDSPVSFDGLLWTSDRFPVGVLVKGDGGTYWRVEAIL
jgi:hypothetical protein